ncbi:MAG TPA: tyrosine--tRNA ligase [Acidimicrobiales bacterium]|jgi:tyrosyl-tRNA synthetase|nr:tyrosine--tRNA ligase [Acidimicrobiales bacterium]
MPGDVFEELRWRGLVHQVTDEGLGAKLAREPFTLYHGIDVTAGSMHVGNLLGVLTLRRLQEAGHRPLVLLGGGTSLIGDPSGRRSERPLLSTEEIAANAAGIRAQLERLLDFDAGPAGATLLNNADWLSPLRVIDFLRDVGKHFTVNVMLAKEAVKVRLEDQDQGISFTEFSYMLLQAYDFLHLFDAWRCRLQVGGSDQWGNITAGIDLIRRARAAEAYGLTWPLVTKADGTKFGKSESGNVWLDRARTSPYRFFQFWMNTDDRDVARYLRLFTFLDRERIELLEADLAERPGRREVHRVLAMEVTRLVHGPEAADAADRASTALFGGDLRDLPADTLRDVVADAPSSDLPRGRLDGDGASLVDLLAESGLVASKSAARQALAQGGVSVNGRKEADVDRRITADDLLDGGFVVLRRGKRSYHVLHAG